MHRANASLTCARTASRCLWLRRPRAVDAAAVLTGVRGLSGSSGSKPRLYDNAYGRNGEWARTTDEGSQPHFANQDAGVRENHGTSGVFTHAEMARRIDGLRKIMSRDGVDVVLLSSFHNIKYFCDFLPCTFGRQYGLLVGPSDVIVISAGIDAGQPFRRAQTATDTIVYTDWHRHGYETAIGEGLRRIGASTGAGKVRLGVELDHLPVTAAARLSEKLGLGADDLIDVSDSTMNFRTIKSTEEIAVIKQGARICDVGGWAAREAMVAGAREWEVARAATGAMVAETATTYPRAELMDTWTWFQSGINTDGAHNPVTNRKLVPGDVLSLNTFAHPNGYYTALERTLFLGHVDDASLAYWEANVEVHRRGLELIKPGARCSEIAAELNELFASKGLLELRSFGYGHSFGVLSHYYGREAAVELREDVDTVLEPGMVVSMEPMITVPDGRPGAGGYREHDILAIDHDGSVSNITGFPFGPEHNVVPC